MVDLTAASEVPERGVRSIGNRVIDDVSALHDEWVRGGTIDGVAFADDVLVAVEGGTIGKTFVVPDDLESFLPSPQLATLRVLDVSRLDRGTWARGWRPTSPRIGSAVWHEALVSNASR